MTDLPGFGLLADESESEDGLFGQAHVLALGWAKGRRNGWVGDSLVGRTRRHPTWAHHRFVGESMGSQFFVPNTLTQQPQLLTSPNCLVVRLETGILPTHWQVFLALLALKIGSLC